ncbi:MAG TPA: glycosyltransferase family 39 protein, partial [Gemmatimonadaceae bacterium]|nr:glycosyltransferase family 39 protein [Gemmatimonadaceae bacterium]
MTRLFLDDPNAVHLVRTVAAGGENNPPLYHLLLRAWASVAGTSTFALRLPSALFVAAAFVLLWRALRREFPWPAVAIALGLTFFPADAVLDQVAQARFYGLFLFSGAAAVATALEVARREQPGPWLLSATGASHLLLLYSHTFGILYSAAIVAALGVLDARARRLRAAPYLAIAAAWLAFVPWIPWVLEQGKMARPTAWIAPPTFRRLSGVMQRLTSPLSLVVAGVGLVALLRRRFGPVAVSIPRNPIAPTVVIGGSVAAVAPLVWLESRLAIPIFVDRYVLPSALGWPLIVAPVIAAVLMRMRDRVATIAGAAAFALLASSAVLAAGRRERTQAPDTLVAPAARFAP